MALVDGIMAQGAGLLQSTLGDSGALVYKSAGGIEVTCNAIIGRERGGLQQDTETGNIKKVTRRTIKITTNQLTAKGITGLEKYAVAVLGDRTWQIEVAESAWGAALVKLVLILPEILRNEGMSRGTV